jgi:pimeloyl-ACP methyl ester carboxylesterase
MHPRPMTRRRRLAVVCALALGAGTAALGAGPATAFAAGSARTITGTLKDGATYLIQVPANWNGTLALYSHGYVTPGSPNPATDVGDPLTGAWLLSNGYALAGSSYATTGWAIQQAIPDQLSTLNAFDRQVGTPLSTIAWGHSLGGMITAALLQVAPDRFAAALPMCGVVAGGVGTWNVALDSALAVQQLLGPNSGLQVVNITDPAANLGIAETLLAGAQATPQGRARIALASALGDIPGWFDPASPEPAPTDYVAQEANQFLWETEVDGPFAYALRAELEARAGGNVSWTAGVNFYNQLKQSSDYKEVQALYAAAGMNLGADMATLQNAAPIPPDRSAIGYLTKYITFNGDLDRPVLTLHTTGDGLVVNQDEQAYHNVAEDAGDAQMLREGYVSRAGHCTFTPAETIAAFETLIHRVDTGMWGSSASAAHLEAAATALGPTYNTVPAAFVVFQPSRFLRPYDRGTN